MPRLTTVLFLVALTLTSLCAAASAQTAKTFAVLPFDYVGPEKYQHYGRSVSSVLRSKFNAPGVFEPATDASAAQLGEAAPGSVAEGVRRLGAAGVDYLVYGVVSVAGDTASLEVNALGASGNLVRESSEVPHDQLSLELDRLAKKINNEVMGVKPQEAAAPRSGAGNPAFLEADPVVSDPSQNINPEFRYEGGSQNEGRIQSQGLRFESSGMLIADGDGDGKNEVFILSDSKLGAYSFEDQRLKELGEFSLGVRNDPIALAGMDINRDGATEIVLSTYSEEGGELSWIFEFRNGKFIPKVERAKTFLNVIKMPPDYMPTLVAQKESNLGGFRSTDAYEAAVSNGEIVTSRPIRLPQFGNIYNITYLPFEKTHKLIMLDQMNRLRVYTEELQPDYAADDAYNSSAMYLNLGSAAVPALESNRDIAEDVYYYIPMPMTVTNLFTGGNKFELLLNKDISVASQVLSRFRKFTQGEIHSMYWDGTGLSLAWKTRRVKGSLVDYELADVDNDGKIDLCVLVNTNPGAINTASVKTVLLVYNLDL
jgi:hypothetical protein